MPTFLNHEANMPDEAIRGVQIILCPFKYQAIILEDESVAVDNLVGESLACDENMAVSLSCL